MKKRFAITKDTLLSLIGIAICLFCLVIICSANSIFSFLSVGILGAFGFIGFWILIPAVFLLGVYLLLRRKLIKFRVDISLWGIYLIILAILILSSAWGSEGQRVISKTIEGNPTVVISMFNTGKDSAGNTYEFLQFNTCVDYIQQIAKNFAIAHKQTDDLVKGFDIANINLGGGYIGYVLCGALNSATTPIGTTIISWLIIVVGLCLVLNRQIKKLFYLIKNKGKHDAAQKAAIEDVYSQKVDDDFGMHDFSYDELDTFEQNEIDDSTIETQNNDEPSNQQLSDLTMRTYNSTHGLQKPKFSLNGEIQHANSQTQLYQTNPFARVSEPVVEQDVSIPVQEIAPVETEEKIMETESPINDLAINQTNVQTPITQEPPKEVVAEVVTDPQHRPQPKAVIRPEFKLPPLNLLDYHENLDDLTKNDESCASRIELLNQAFVDLKVGASVSGYTIGPSVTRYDIKTNTSVSVSAIKKIIEDISIRLGGVMARFEPIVLGKPTSGLEIENAIRTNVGLREAMEKLPEGEKFLCNIPFGKDISGQLVHANVKDFPHMLVAGTTGSGKSIFMHSTILALIMRNTPYQLKLLLIDPKKVEMSYYREIPHLLCPNISEPRKALVAMKKLVDEMQRRYNLFEQNRVRDIKEFNAFAKANGIEPLPVIVVCVDEYADLSDDCKEIRDPVVRIAQKARSAGIHLIIATQRPSVDVIDGVIKANISTHVALMVSSFADSSVIIGESGAEKLLGNGDMIVDCASISKTSKPRVQGCFVDTPEINRVTDYLRKQSAPLYDPEFLDLTEHTEEMPTQSSETIVDLASLKEQSEEKLYETIKLDLANKEYCSISFIQRTYGVGFPKAGRLFNKLVKEGIVAPSGDARGCKVLVHLTEQSDSSPTSIDQSNVYEDTSEIEQNSSFEEKTIENNDLGEN